MNAVHSVSMTVDWSRFLAAIGLDLATLGAATARRTDEPGSVSLSCIGPAETDIYLVSEPAADVVHVARRLALLDGQLNPVIALHLQLAQLATGSSHLGRLVWESIDARLSPIDLFQRFVNSVGISPAQLVMAQSLYRDSRGPHEGVLDDYTDELFAEAFWNQRERPALVDQLEKLRDTVHVDHDPLIDRAIRTVQIPANPAASSSGAFSDLGDFADARRLFQRALDPRSTTEAIDDWHSCAATIAGTAFHNDAHLTVGPLGAIALSTRVSAGDWSAATIGRLLGAKRQLLAVQESRDPVALNWASELGTPLPELAVHCGALGAWEVVAELACTNERLTGLDSAIGFARRPMVAPTVPFVMEDLKRCDVELLCVAWSMAGVAVSHRHTDGRWTGKARRVDGEAAHETWTRRWRRAVKVGTINSVLDELLELLGIDLIDVDGPVVHIMATGLARGLPIGQALSAASRGRIEIKNHLLGGPALVHSSGVRQLDENVEVCIVHEPPVPGRPLRFAQIETAFVRSVTSPVAMLDDSRTTRSWVQRAVAAHAGVPSPSILHFAGHGTVSAMPDGSTAAAIVLADGEPFAPADFAMVDAGVRVLVCAACDVAGAASRGGQNLADGALRAGVEQVVAAAWPIDDAATTCLMARTYHEWATGADGIASALGRAVRWLAASETADLVAFALELPGPPALVRVLADEVMRVSGERPSERDPSLWAGFGFYEP